MKANKFSFVSEWTTENILHRSTYDPVDVHQLCKHAQKHSNCHDVLETDIHSNRLNVWAIIFPMNFPICLNEMLEYPHTKSVALRKSFGAECFSFSFNSYWVAVYFPHMAQFYFIALHAVLRTRNDMPFSSYESKW